MLTLNSLNSHALWVYLKAVLMRYWEYYWEQSGKEQCKCVSCMSSLFTCMFHRSFRLQLQNTASKIKLLRISRWLQESIKWRTRPSECGDMFNYIVPVFTCWVGPPFLNVYVLGSSVYSKSIILKYLEEISMLHIFLDSWNTAAQDINLLRAPHLVLSTNSRPSKGGCI